MSHLAQHMRTRLVDGRVIAKSPTERRIAMRTIFRLAADSQLLAVSLVDAHLHLLDCCTPQAGSKFLHAVEVSLKRRLSLPVGFVMYPHEPVRDGRHLRYAFRYVLTQHSHHGVQTDPLREGTNLHDLLGLRLVGSDTHSHMRRWLPRVSRAELLGWLGVANLEPADGPLEWVRDAALSAACLTTLTGKSRQVRGARRAILEVVGPRYSSGDLAGILQVTQRSVQRLWHQPVDQRLVQALRLQLAIRTQLSVSEDVDGIPEPKHAPAARKMERGILRASK